MYGTVAGLEISEAGVLFDLICGSDVRSQLLLQRHACPSAVMLPTVRAVDSHPLKL